MAEQHETDDKIHYICQTYVEKSGKKIELKVEKLFEYTSGAQAEERATREHSLGNCVGADAYMLVEDSNSGEVSAPVFLTRLGQVPEFDEY